MAEVVKLVKRADRGEIIRRKRMSAGLTVGYLASRVSISEQHLSRIELGERDPGNDTLNKIAQQLSMTPPERDELHLAYGVFPLDVQSWIQRNPVKTINIVRQILKKRRENDSTV